MIQYEDEDEIKQCDNAAHVDVAAAQTFALPETGVEVGSGIADQALLGRLYTNANPLQRRNVPG